MKNNQINFIFFIFYSFIPFSGINGIEFLAEYKNFLSYYALIPLVLLLIFIQTKIKTSLVKIFILLNFIFGINFLFNVQYSYFNEIRFIKQIIAINFLLLGAGVMSAYAENNTENFLKIAYRSINFILPILLLYIFFIQIPYIFFDNTFCKNLMLQLQSFGISTHLNSNRVFGFSGEPAFLAIYLFFVTPILIFFYKLNNKSIKILFLFLMLACLVFLIKSRIGYLLLLTQSFTYCYFYWKKTTINTAFIFSFLSFFTVILVFYFFNTFDENIHFYSNLQRINSIVTAYNIFIDHPILGIGWGQYETIYEEYFYFFADSEGLPHSHGNWDTSDMIIHNLYLRVLSETGLVGATTFIYFFIYWPIKKINCISDVNYKFLFTSLFTSNLILFLSIQSLKFEVTLFFIALLFIFSPDNYYRNKIISSKICIIKHKTI